MLLEYSKSTGCSCLSLLHSTTSLLVHPQKALIANQVASTLLSTADRKYKNHNNKKTTKSQGQEKGIFCKITNESINLAY